MLEVQSSQVFYIQVFKRHKLNILAICSSTRTCFCYSVFLSKMLFFSWLPLVPSLSSKSYPMNDFKEFEGREDGFGGKGAQGEDGRCTHIKSWLLWLPYLTHTHTHTLLNTQLLYYEQSRQIKNYSYSNICISQMHMCLLQTLVLIFYICKDRMLIEQVFFRY